MKTKIEWADESWNPVKGCSRVSEGCRNCYAESIAKRFSKPGLPYEGLIAKGGQWNGKISVVDDKFDLPLRWKKPRKVFVNSMSDLFHEDLAVEQIARVFAVMYLSTQHTFQVLTKRPERMKSVLTNPRFYNMVLRAADAFRLDFPKTTRIPIGDPTKFPYGNVWLGVSIEDQKTANERIPILLETPAAVRFVSAEPLLDSINLRRNIPSESMLRRRNPMIGMLDWVICGGESGPNARPMHPDWAKSLRNQCVNAGVPFLFKQWGSWVPVSDAEGPGNHHYLKDGATVRRVGKKKSGRLLDGELWDQYPVEPNQ